MKRKLNDVRAIAQQAFDSLPERFRRAAEGVVIRVEHWPDNETLKTMNIASVFGLLGLYHGVALPFKSVLDAPTAADMVTLYRAPMIAYARQTGEPLEDVVRHVLVHELGHHFGFSDEDMEAIEAREDA
ncbi:MAG: metallopeptidase family protein [Hyphomicrobiales bacterium]|nr:metallopeptidase family protein [Hyphomicrobiales bacterium]